MGSMDRGLISIIGSINSVVVGLVAIAVLVLGLVVVRPKHATAGVVFAGAGGARLLGVAISFTLSAMRPTGGDYETAMAFGVVQTLVSMFFGVIFWGGIAVGAYQMAEAATKQQGVRS